MCILCICIFSGGASKVTIDFRLSAPAPAPCASCVLVVLSSVVSDNKKVKAQKPAPIL